MLEMIEDTRFVDVIELGEKLLREFGLNDWTFDLMSKKTTLGICSHGRKKITFSTYYLHIPMEEIEDTIRHEIAHALVGRGHGHDDDWKQMAISCGARPQALAPPDIHTSAKYKYVIECPECKQRWYRYRMRRRNFGSLCPNCRVPVHIYDIHYD